MPVAIGWHPYLRLPGARRSRWRLRLPARDCTWRSIDRGIPNGAASHERAEAAEVGTRTFDDCYELGRDRRLTFSTEEGHSVELHCGANYPFAQVWVPKGHPFAALEPMAAPTNALVTGEHAARASRRTVHRTFALTLDRETN